MQQAAADRVGCPVLQGWGMTEMVAGGAIWRLGTPIVPGAAGMLFPGLDARVVDLADGTDLPPGEAGELLIRTPSVMAGYRGAPGQPPRRSTPTAGCTPATSPRCPPTAWCTSSTGSRS